MDIGTKQISRRQRQVGEVVRQALSSTIGRWEPLSGGAVHVLTVSEVIMSSDLRQARVYFSVLGNSAAASSEVQKALNREAPAIQYKIKSLVDLRFLPRLRFFVDTAFETAQRIQEALDQQKA